jgi:hypothetical protein
MRKDSVVIAVMYAVVVSLLGSACAGLSMAKYPMQWMYSALCFVFYSGYFYDEWHKAEHKCRTREFLSWCLFAAQAVTLRWLFLSMILCFIGVIIIFTTLKWKNSDLWGERGWIVQNAIFIVLHFILGYMSWDSKVFAVIKDHMTWALLWTGVCICILSVWKILAWNRRKNDWFDLEIPYFLISDVDRGIKVSSTELAFVQFVRTRLNGERASGNRASVEMTSEMVSLGEYLNIEQQRCNMLFVIVYSQVNTTKE